MKKTPDEIKKELECCAQSKCGLDECSYFRLGGGSKCIPAMCADALALVQQLEAQVPRWISVKEPPEKWRLDDEEQTLVNYLIYSPEFGVDVGNYLQPAKTWVLFGVPVKVTHWMDITTLPVIDEE